MLYSFDVFDTLITRTTATPQGIFALMQSKLLRDSRYAGISDYIRENFFRLRINAEELARLHYQKNEIEDITLGHIYEAMGTTGCLLAEEQVLLAALERETECANVIGIQENIEKVKSLLAANQQVVFISDMYLDEITIRAMLAAVDPIFKAVPLYVSSEHRQGKYSCNLYKLVRDREKGGGEYENWLHCGDNPHSDAVAASTLSISTHPFAYEQLMPIEKEKLSTNETDCGAQLCIGAARNVRLRYRLSGPSAIGCTVAGPILFPYVQWILEMSQRRGIKRLYFIARDGFLLKKIADILIEKCKLAISTHYIYGSRKVWRMPSYDGKKGSLRRLLSWSYPRRITSFNKLAEALQISYEELMNFLPDGCRKVTGEIPYPALCACVMRLENNPAFRRFFYQAQQQDKELVQQYLRQELDLSDDDFAFVDLGGGGLTQGCLAGIMKAFYAKPIQTFFFKMDRINLMQNCLYYNFLPSKLKNNLVIEMICRASHGQTDGYREEAGKIVPVLKEDEGAAIFAHGYESYVDGIEKFTNAYTEIMKRYDIPVRLELVLQYMNYIMLSPDQEILDFFADMPNSVTGREQQTIGFAPKLTKKDIRDMYLLDAHEAFERRYHGTDLEYSKLRCSESEKKKIAFYQRNRQQVAVRFERLMKRKLIAESQREVRLKEFPYPIFGNRLVIYGAGRFGGRIYDYIKKAGCDVVQWLDKDYELLSKQKVPVSGTIHSLGEEPYDAIIIAVLSENLAEDIKLELLAMNVAAEKIIYLVEAVEYNSYLDVE